MRIITLSNHGCKVGTAPSITNPEPPKRGVVGGWSPKSAARNVDFLRSVDYSSLSGIGFAFTGTLKDCPSSSDEWAALRRAFIERLRRIGLIRSHWVTEWQRRGVPHLHGMFFFPDNVCTVDTRRAVIAHWLELTASYGSKPISQTCKPLHDALGWSQYSAKHASRGVNHYQRSPENIPPEWKNKTGRVWGKTGDWGELSEVKLTTNSDVYYTFRRFLRSWRIADARKSGNRWRVLSAKKCLKCNDRNLSHVRGMSEWCPVDTSTILLAYADALHGGGNWQPRIKK